uniref:UDPglucose:glycoprotein glucosyltransferase putative n=1 Tax=Albugo laibachii Nc14 TaxID=890382 RepID=F0W0C8_9STRA|nr:UDPglucose:glycoprotein glucosyltransferase putative [Albugo laibachii Nc14]|eukprot:CCA14500.1 UDPglucose:glycoprotein glucosyltransferase putative [Albugo laibachii Nc14]
MTKVVTNKAPIRAVLMRLIVPLIPLFVAFLPQCDSRAIHVNVTASWRSAITYPLTEISEFLAQEDPRLFWQWIDLLGAGDVFSTKMNDAADAETEVVLDVSGDAKSAVTAQSKSWSEMIENKHAMIERIVSKAMELTDTFLASHHSIIKLALLTRSYSPKVEMFRQMALDSVYHTSCDNRISAWAVVSNSKCVLAYACSIKELDALLQKSYEETSACIGPAENDRELPVDHVFVGSGDRDTASQKLTIILYGAIATNSFFDLHETIKPFAKIGRFTYIVRHYNRDSSLPTLLQGYGVSLDIKNMEYKTIDDDEHEKADDDHDDSELDNIDGISSDQKSALSEGLQQLEKESLQKQVDDTSHDEEQSEEWNLNDLGMVATFEILQSKNPVRHIKSLSQDFPKHAKRLAMAKNLLPSDIRETLRQWRISVVSYDYLDTLVVNGIPISATRGSFNAFDLLKLIQQEWSLVKKFSTLGLQEQDIIQLRQIGVAPIAEARYGTEKVVRIMIRGPVDGITPIYLTNIETDPSLARLPKSINALKSPSWHLIQIRRNMYEIGVIFDPTTQSGVEVLREMHFLYSRGAPIQFGILPTSKALLNTVDPQERVELIRLWKRVTLGEQATSFHFSKIIFLIRGQALGDLADESLHSQFTKFLSLMLTLDVGYTVSQLIGIYQKTIADMVETKDEVLAILKSDRLDEEVLSITEFISRKHLPFECHLFNGIIQPGLSLQENLMDNFGREQHVYQSLAREAKLSGKRDLIEQLLEHQDTYNSYFTIYSDSANKVDFHSFVSESNAASSLLNNDLDETLERMLTDHVTYLHPIGSATVTKKETLVFHLSVFSPSACGHAYQGVAELLRTDSNHSSTARVGIVHLHENTPSNLEEDRKKVGQLILDVLSKANTTDEKIMLEAIAHTFKCQMEYKSYEDTKQSLLGLLETFESNYATEWKELVKAHVSLPILKVDPDKQRLSNLLAVSTGQCGNSAAGKLTLSTSHLFLNGRCVDLSDYILGEFDIKDLIAYDLETRTEDAAKVVLKDDDSEMSVQDAGLKSLYLMKVCGLLDQYRHWDRYNALDLLTESGTKNRSMIHIDGDSTLNVVAFLDPLTEATQRMSSILETLQTQLNATIDIILVPDSEYSEFPLRRFYQYVFGNAPLHLGNSILNGAAFRSLPIKPILTMNIDTVEEWNVHTHESRYDADNLMVDPKNEAEVRGTKTVSYILNNVLVYGRCVDVTDGRMIPPNGLQLILHQRFGNEKLSHDTLVMRNLGYFQLQATPGIWSLHLARGRAANLYEIVMNHGDSSTETEVVYSIPVFISDFNTRKTNLVVKKRVGKEQIALLDSDEHDDANYVDEETKEAGTPGSVLTSYWNSVSSLLTGRKSAISTSSDEALKNSKETIHVFSLATGHLYERFLKIMMLSVVKRTKSDVVFWLLENFLSPNFKRSVPALQAEFGIEIRLITYKWPKWLRRQTVKQRIIWGYKILFLDVLFPLHINKIIYVDSDQVVRADLKELWEMDLKGAVYAYAPFCGSRNLGFQFWREGFWKSHLQGKPYHISALYLVDLKQFRKVAAGDTLRGIYEQLSSDPNSLANLDQDLPNFVQHNIPIFTLPQEWLWCESWCSDETKAEAKTIDLCNNPKEKEPKLEMAKRVISGDLFQESWIQLDQEIRESEKRYVAGLQSSDAGTI